MKKNIIINSLMIGILSSSLLITSCGKSEDTDSAALIEFGAQIDSFCNNIYNIDSSINQIDTSADGYETQLLADLDTLNNEFSNFGSIDFPSDYDYLEGLSAEAAEYMNTANTSFHDIFENEYSSETIESKYEYASENYQRAYKRVQIIVSFLNGKVSEDISYTEGE